MPAGMRGALSGSLLQVVGVHRNTTAYRLKRIEEVTGWDLREPDLRLALSLALRILDAEGGFDGIELQCSHSSIVRGFLSPATNKRTDEYGGSLVNRVRILAEIVAAELDWSTLKGLSTVGITAGASAPELLVNEIIDAFRAHYDVSVEQVTLREENVTFKLPRELREVPATP